MVELKEKKWFEGDFCYDLETYKNIFTFCIVRADGKHLKVFEVSDRKNETEEILNCLRYLKNNNCRMVGFNNNGFDYPILHRIMQDAMKAKRKKEKFLLNANYCYQLAQQQILSFRDGFGNTIRQNEMLIPQVDLYKINHFDNKAKATSLKMLEFNMRSETIEDLPYHHTSVLDSKQMDVLIEYNKHDVLKTLEFYYHNYSALLLRQDLTAKIGIDFTNHNDTKIGKDYFIVKLESENPGCCYKKVGERRIMNQTVRNEINLGDCLFKYYEFERPEFEAVRKWFSEQVIKETKGVFTNLPEHKLGDVAKYAELTLKRKKFKGKPTDKEIEEFKIQFPLGEVVEEELKATEWLFDSEGNHVLEYPLDEWGNVDTTKKPKKVRVPKKSYWMTWKVATCLNVVIDGFRFDFGVGGIHGSLTSITVKPEKGRKLKDADVSSMYPNLGIANRVYPEHLGEKFCDIYQDVYERRKSYPKGSAENLVMKLALNGVYGDSNNEYSPFFDTKYTMTITVNGQLSICLLVDKLLKIEGLKIIQVNTDGVTCEFPEDKSAEYDAVCKQWEKTTGLQLEFADYSVMYIRDVNNYIALYTNGKVKRKGAYQYEDLGWHQNHSCLVVPKAAEAFLVHGKDIREFISEHKDHWDFMLRTKVPKSSRLVMVYEDGYEVELQNTCRYYACKKGGKLVKLMPPTEKQISEGKTEDRRLSIDTAWNLRACNNMKDYDGDIDFDYYVAEAEKLASLTPVEEDSETEE